MEMLEEEEIRGEITTSNMLDAVTNIMNQDLSAKFVVRVITILDTVKQHLYPSKALQWY